MTITNAPFTVSDYIIRKEDGGYLLFLSSSGKCLLINETSKLILDCLKEGKTFLETISIVSGLATNLVSLQSFCNYFLLLTDYKIIMVNNTESNASLPTIEDLDKIHIKGKQCVTFGMPKRSCKSLPTGLNDNN
jgi:hypothetical protein